MTRIALVMALTMAAVAGPAQAGTLQPGMMIVSPAGECTANFVFDGTGPLYGRVFLGTAAHCVKGVGEVVFEGYERTAGVVGFDQNLVAFGTVVASGPDPQDFVQDWALIEVRPERIKDVNPQMKGHPELPRGTEIRSPGDVAAGDFVQFSGYAQLFDATQPTREERVGVFSRWHEWGYIELVGPASLGDSGGPIVHLPSGRPLALHSRFLGLYTTPIVNLVRSAAEAGFPVAVRTLDSPPVPPPPPPAQPAQPTSMSTPAASSQPAKPSKAKPKSKAKPQSKAKKKKRKKRRKSRRRATARR